MAVLPRYTVTVPVPAVVVVVLVAAVVEMAQPECTVR